MEGPSYGASCKSKTGVSLTTPWLYNTALGAFDIFATEFFGGT